MGLERGPLSLVSITEELLRRKSSGSGLENPDYSRKGSVALTTLHPLSANVATTPTSGGCLVGIVRSQTRATELRKLLYSATDAIANVNTVVRAELRLGEGQRTRRLVF
jgi:hypothetical protein